MCDESNTFASQPPRSAAHPGKSFSYTLYLSQEATPGQAGHPDNGWWSCSEPKEKTAIDTRSWPQHATPPNAQNALPEDALHALKTITEKNHVPRPQIVAEWKNNIKKELDRQATFRKALKLD